MYVLIKFTKNSLIKMATRERRIFVFLIRWNEILGTFQQLCLFVVRGFSQPLEEFFDVYHSKPKCHSDAVDCPANKLHFVTYIFI